MDNAANHCRVAPLLDITIEQVPRRSGCRRRRLTEPLGQERQLSGGRSPVRS